MPFNHNSESSLGITLPQNTSGHGNVLRVGRGISVYLDLQPPNIWPKHEHPIAQIMLVLDPVDVELTWWCGNCIYRECCSRPHVWCVPKGMPHAITWSGTGAMVVFYVEQELMREECGALLTEGAVLSLSPLLQQDYLFARFCRRFQDHCHRRKHLSEPMLFAGAILLSVTALRVGIGHMVARRRPARGLSDRRMEKVALYLEDHLREPVTPADLAAAVGMSEDHFARMLRLSTGLPPMRYVWRCRLHRARQLLETGEWKVAQVAAETGFCDQSHLDRKFRKEFGCTPGFVIPPKARD